MESQEIKIIEILPDDTNAGIGKCSLGYVFRVRYLLEDGSVQASTQSRRLLRDAKAEVASLPKSPAHPTTARFRDGRLVSVETAYFAFGPVA
jgi:hypothetical protein